MHPLISTLLLLNMPSPDPWHARDSCAVELNRMHTVRVRQRVFLLYGDPDLAAYLQTVLGNPHSVSVVPVYTGEPVALLHDGMAIVSTGLILRAGHLEDLRAAFPQAKPSRFRFLKTSIRRAPVLTSCSHQILPGPFEQHKSRLARDVSQYEEWTRPQLRRRTAVVVSTE